MQLPMTRPNRHRIQRQIVELVDRRQRARVRPCTRNWPARSGIVPFRSWSKCSIGAAGPHELLRLDRLELDLGKIGGARLAGGVSQKTGRGAHPQPRAVHGRFDSADEDAPQRSAAGRALAGVPVLSGSRLPAVVGRQAGRRLDRRVVGSSGCGRLERAARNGPSPIRARECGSCSRSATSSWNGDRQMVGRAARRSSAGAVDAEALRADARRRWRRGFWMMRARLGVRRRVSLAARRPAARARSDDAAAHV